MPNSGNRFSTRLAERFGHHLQRDRFSRTRGTRYQSMTVGHFTNDAQRPSLAMGDVKSMFSVVHIRIVLVIVEIIIVTNANVR